jgi:hypothetical protein
VIKWKQRAGRGVFTDWGKERACRVWWGNLRERDHLEDVIVDKRILLK